VETHGLLAPGARIEIADSVLSPLTLQDFGRRYLTRTWVFQKDGDTSRVFADRQKEDVQLGGIASNNWDLGPFQNPIRPPGDYLEGAVVRLDLPERTPVQVRIVDATGRLITSRNSLVTPFSQNYGLYGVNQLSLADPQDQVRIHSGVYFYQLTLKDGRTSHGRFMVLK
jgi:hypothetical protein